MPRSARSRHAPVSQRDGRRSYVHHEIASSSRLTVTAISTFANNLVGILVKRCGDGFEYAMQPGYRSPKRRESRRPSARDGARSADCALIERDDDTRARTRPLKNSAASRRDAFAIAAMNVRQGSRCFMRKTLSCASRGTNRTRVRHRAARSLA